MTLRGQHAIAFIWINARLALQLEEGVSKRLTATLGTGIGGLWPTAKVGKPVRLSFAGESWVGPPEAGQALVLAKPGAIDL